MENKVNTLKATTIAGTVGAGIGAATNVIYQRKILNHPDEFITRIKGEIESRKKFNNPFHKGTQQAADLANKKLDECLKKAEQFITKGKINYSAVAKYAAIGGAIAAGFAGFFALINNAHKKEVRDNAKIVADEFKKAQIDENK